MPPRLSGACLTGLLALGACVTPRQSPPRVQAPSPIAAPRLVAAPAVSAAAAAAPSAVAAPGKGKPRLTGHGENRQCRAQAAAELVTRNRLAGTRNPTADEMQERYDSAYAECLAAIGNGGAPPRGESHSASTSARGFAQAPYAAPLPAPPSFFAPPGYAFATEPPAVANAPYGMAIAPRFDQGGDPARR